VPPPHFSPKQAGNAKLSPPTASFPKVPLNNVQSAGTASPRRTSFLPRRVRYGTADMNLCTAPLKSLPHPVVACAEHRQHGPLTRSSLLLSLNLVLAELDGSHQTIGNTDATVAVVWGEGFSEIRNYARGDVPWEDDCAWCTVESILLGRGGLVLLTGVLSLGKTGLYDQLLGALASYGSESQIKEFDMLIRKFVQLHKRCNGVM